MPDPTTHTSTGTVTRPLVTRRRLPRRLTDVRIGAKLGLLLLIPLLAAMALAGMRLAENAARAAEADTVRSLTAVAAHAAAVAHHLHQERVEATKLLAAGGDPAAFHTQTARTDTAIDGYHTQRGQLNAVPPLAEVRLAVVDEHLASLATLRRQVLGDPPLTTPAVSLRYSAIGTDIQAYLDTAAAVIEDPALSQQARAVAAMSQAARHAAEAQAIAQLIAADPALADEHTGAFLASQAGQQEAFGTFRQVADPAQRGVTERLITGGNVEAAATGVAALRQPDLEDDLQPAAAALAGMVDLTQHVETQLHQQLLHAATASRDLVFQRTLIESAAVLTALAAAVLLAAVLARAMTRALGRLEAGALAVAERDLPATVAYLSDPNNLGAHTPQQLAAAVGDPVHPASRDQIGQVATAFNVVHRAAVRVAAEQAALRTSVAAMFLNLARRSQALVDRMISHLDEIERHEEDPNRLKRMFTLDHLATRMRRNDENLLVLAGADSSPPRGEPALIADVLRAAQSEVEHYARVEFGVVDADVSVTAAAVNDVVRLLAELLDNATRLSPPQTPVICEARRLGDQVIVQVDDEGVGMPPQRRDQLNTMLAAPPTLEVATFRQMGLAVVARLATRHQIRVELHANQHRGTIAYVSLPQAILVLPPARLRAFDPIPHRDQPAPPLPARHIGQRNHHHLPPSTPPPTARHGLDDTSPPPTGTVATAAEPAPVSPSRTAELPVLGSAQQAWLPAHHPPAHRPPAPTQPDSPESRDSPPAAPQPPAPVRSGNWHTAADAGWAAATAASRPTPGGATTTGLPRRQPQAQLVPGGLATSSKPALTQRRTPEQVRSLLAAYHRGVQQARDHHRP